MEREAEVGRIEVTNHRHRIRSSCSSPLFARDSIPPLSSTPPAKKNPTTHNKRLVKQGAFGDRMFHYRAPVAVDDQPVVRPNRDTLYSVGVLDLDAGPATVTLPRAIAADGSTPRFMSALVISEDHYMEPVVYAPAKFTVDKKEIGTR